MKSHLRRRRVGVVPALVFLALVLSVFTTTGALASQHKVSGNLVMRTETAIAIAKAVAEETYGAKSIAAQLPLVALRKGNTWHVSGQLPAGIPGGVVEVWVAVSDGRVIRLTHGK